ncbi:hypothetical protein [Metabacillus fastidiosus]|uniref:hypothetical protein n=1 Tax=Metabacillus fastidiosus TaxID=1458 RepID=UPI002E1A8D69|nr:hypothetical protein [Metabacillus fastidiosus]
MLTQQVEEAKRQYMKEYRKKNRERILERQRKYYHENKEKYKEYQQRYWAKVALERGDKNETDKDQEQSQSNYG